MRIRTAFAATALAACTILGGAGTAAASDDGHYGIGNGEDVISTSVESNEVEFGDMVMD